MQKWYWKNKPLKKLRRNKFFFLKLNTKKLAVFIKDSQFYFNVRGDAIQSSYTRIQRSFQVLLQCEAAGCTWPFGLSDSMSQS